MIVRIHISLLLMIAYIYFFGNIKIFIISYLFIIMHELSHMIIAIILDTDILALELTPFGVTARYANKPSIFNEMLISVAGPLATLVFAYAYKNDLYLNINLCILIFNLLPIYPFDGGRIIKAILLLLLGNKRGSKVSLYINNIAVFLLLIFSLTLFIKTKNFISIVFSMCIINICLNESKFNYLQKPN